jgi:hypothetical protein
VLARSTRPTSVGTMCSRPTPHPAALRRHLRLQDARVGGDGALADRKASSLRRHRVATMYASYLDPKRRYVHLVDGGVADNLGLRGPLDNVLLAGGL